MRSKDAMLNLITGTAKADERIRAVILNGSRANPNARRDPFQDFDIVYLVTEVAPFRNNQEWIRRFGETMILQMPDDMGAAPPKQDGGFTYLMQFSDGNRIDLRIYPLANLSQLEKDSLSVVLLDKDELFVTIAPTSENDYFPKPPSAKEFGDCCNEFWWVCPYVAKGLWREEILYAKYNLDHYGRDQLLKMITWYAGFKTGFTQNPGLYGKNFHRLLEPELWEMLMRTYSDAGYENTWEALFAMGDLFRMLAVPVADYFGFDYPEGDDRRVSTHLKHIRSLPRDAQEIY